jgi:hypothetical protein
MMKLKALILGGAAAALALAPTAAPAQARRYVRPPIAKYQPYTSPYLAMFGPGGAEYGYFINTLPIEQNNYQQYNFGRGYRSFQNTVDRDFQQIGQMGQDPGILRTIGTTGHPTGFMMTGSYFPGAGPR